MTTRNALANFDRIARPYRWMEYLAFGPALWRCRTYFLPQLTDRRNALVLGDGDGRFTAALLAAHPRLRVDAVDTSAAMLHLLTTRARAATSDAKARLRARHSDALAFVQSLPAIARYDLIVTHFFLDCLSQAELDTLTQAILPHLAPGALWLVSDFRVGSGAMHWPACILVRSLYLAFRILTGLRTAFLPDHPATLAAAGFAPAEQRLTLAGILTAELWVYTPASEPAYTPHHAAAAATSAT